MPDQDEDSHAFGTILGKSCQALGSAMQPQQIEPPPGQAIMGVPPKDKNFSFFGTS